MSCGDGAPPTGLPPENCQTVYDSMHLAASIMVSIAQTAGYLVSCSIVLTRRLWLDFVKFNKRKPSTLKMESIAHADIDKKGLFGAGLQEILARQETFLDRKPVFEDVLPRDKVKTERTRSTDPRPKNEPRRDRSPLCDRPSHQSSGPTRSQRPRDKTDKGRFWRPNPRTTARSGDNQHRDDDCGGDRARAQQRNNPYPPVYYGASRGRK